VSSRDDFLFSGKEDELFMQVVYSYGTGPEEKAKSYAAGGKKALVTTLSGKHSCHAQKKISFPPSIHM
jgi:hypothetical protein